MTSIKSAGVLFCLLSIARLALTLPVARPTTGGDLQQDPAYRFSTREADGLEELLEMLAAGTRRDIPDKREPSDPLLELLEKRRGTGVAVVEPSGPPSRLVCMLAKINPAKYEHFNPGCP
ncbi:hypothetical protein GP486_007718 [Trichoglossum hirsutum]|uniref:Uncharacterized protein n=1 Tax=Trichoglossum hirsutum TaxID=265104 RepID=A0A9P8L6P3_9PEZI|nr:hypothetical protein GP486_007718 [Trichoglossum hirsutum]